MKKLVEEVSGEGLESLIGDMVEVLCTRYIYHGKLSGVNDNDILITDASIIYNTGDHGAQKYDDIQPLKRDIYLRIASIEYYMKAK